MGCVLVLIEGGKHTSVKRRLHVARRSALLKRLERGQGAPGIVDGNEDMVVKRGRDDIATDVRLAERAGEGGGQADRVQVGVNRQRNPGGAK